MAYPPLIRLDQDTESRLIAYIDQELFNHYAERGEWLDRIIKYQKEYWAEPASEQITYPYASSATLIVPLTAIAIEAVFARIMTTRFALDQLVSIQPISDDYADKAEPFERYFNQYLIDTMRLKKPFGDMVLELLKYGTGAGRSTYERVVRKAYRDVDGKREDFEVVTKQGAQIYAVPISRFLMPFSAKDPQLASWCGEEHSAGELEIKVMVDSGLLYPESYEKLQAFFRNQQTLNGQDGTSFTRSQQDLEKMAPIWPKQVDWAELWLAWDTDGSGDYREIVVHYHRLSRQILSIRYNWHEDLRRPYRTAVYFPIEHRWTGIGIAQQNSQFQEEITTQHRQRIDNASMANMRMLKVSKLSDYDAGEPLFPGKMFFVDEMDHIDSIQMGEIYPSSYQNEQSTLIYSQQRSGVNEVTLGMPQVGTPGTATSDLARIQEGNKKFDLVYDNVNGLLGDLTKDAAADMIQFGPRFVEFLDYRNNGKAIREVFDLPSDLLKSGAVLRMVPATSQYNRILDRQNWQQLSGIYQQGISGIMQLAQGMGDQEIMRIISVKGVEGAMELMRQIMQSFDVPNINRILPLEQLQTYLNTLQEQANAVRQVPNEAGTQGIIQLPQGIQLPGIPQSVT